MEIQSGRGEDTYFWGVIFWKFDNLPTGGFDNLAPGGFGDLAPGGLDNLAPG